MEFLRSHVARVPFDRTAVAGQLPKPVQAILSDMSTSQFLVYASLLSISLLVLASYKQLYLLLRFAWACFIKPTGSSAQQKERLDSFYRNQAGIYDATRRRLLKGREEMLQLVASHLRQQLAEQPGKKLIWCDIGGGTGYNIEKMDEYFGLANFQAVFLIDLCEPLLEVARRRFAAKGWKNVHVLCQDANNFVLPDLEDGSVPTGLSLCTLSYSLSMIPSYYSMLDRIERFLESDGLVGVVDFYVSEKRSTKTVMDVCGDVGRYCSWVNRTFWLHWFEFDGVDLHPSRRAYLEWRFGTVKSVNARNDFAGLASIPYYIWLGCKARKDLSGRLAEFGQDPLTPAFSPTLCAAGGAALTDSIPDLALTSPALSPTSISPPRTRSSRALARASSTGSNAKLRLDIPFDATGSPLSTFYYQNKSYRMPYIHGPEQAQFRSWIYGFTWEDPEDDIRRMQISRNETVLCITSAGDNALHYVAAKGCKRVHCVDMNPCQGHLLELKLAGINALQYEEFWELFGLGRHADFGGLLDAKLAPYLSAHAYAFWKKNAAAFDSQFYLQGYSGTALRILAVLFGALGKGKDLLAFAQAETLEAQVTVYEARIRPVLLNLALVKLVLSNPIFLWNGLGVPMNQLRLLLSETSVRQYVIDTFDPIGRTCHVRTQNYHYYLCLTTTYSPDNPPLYLTRAGFAKLKADACARLDAFRLHTDRLNNVIRNNIEAGSLDVAITMDHADWHSPDDPAHVDELKSMIRGFRRAMPVGGRAYWRSAAMDPWYTKLWELEGFRVERLSVRTIGTQKPIDTVNMYASLWRAIRL